MFNEMGRHSDLIKKYGVIFAFSRKQFEEQANPEYTYSKLGMGGFIPSHNVSSYEEGLDKIDQDRKEYYTSCSKRLKTYVFYELANHEAHLSYDYIADVLPLVKNLGVDRNKLIDYYNEWVGTLTEDNY